MSASRPDEQKPVRRNPTIHTVWNMFTICGRHKRNSGDTVRNPPHLPNVFQM